MASFRRIAGRIKNKGNCVICGFDFTEKFPNDFPEEFKFCCSCLLWAKFIIEEKYDTLFSETSVVGSTIKKILNILTLVEGK